MTMQKAVARIRTDTIEHFIGEDRPLLIAVLRKDPDLLEHLKVLMEVVMEFKEEVLVACYTLEDLLPYFAERFGVGGTPTYLFVRNGELLGSLLGKNSRSTLIGFVRERLEESAGAGHTGDTMGAGVPAGSRKGTRGIR